MEAYLQMRLPENIYDERYIKGYRQSLSGYELARWKALNHFLKNVVKYENPEKVLDYGCGNGLFYPLLKSLFPEAEIYGADISTVAIDQIKEKYPEINKKVDIINNDKTTFPSNLFDVVVSVEVMEHVAGLQEYLKEINRILKEDGVFVWTTPCANRYSIEHIYSILTKQIELSSTGEKRWKWEDPTHLRRLTSEEVEIALKKSGFYDVDILYRAHFFSFACTKLIDLAPKFSRLFEKMMNLDYLLFKYLKNGASMVGVAKKK